MSDRELYCDFCRGVMLFEALPCGDGHGADCPDDCSGSPHGGRHGEPAWSELACTGCGAALLIAGYAFHTPRLDHHRTTHPRRHAA